MTRHKVSLSVPATIYDFGESKESSNSKLVTDAKLKVFYVGTTEDKRVFNKKFSDKLLKTLPGTPVVAFYDEEKEDFVGHHHTQYVFGYVPHDAEIGYEDEDGRKFAVTDVKLFTGRKDNIGEIASKIIGKQHSLELDPDSVQYNIMSAGGKIRSIEFIEGAFCGLSVLGDDEKPAFKGSEFFTETDETAIEAFVNSFREFVKEVTEIEKNGGDVMDKDNLQNLPITNYEQFMKRVLNERAEILEQAVANAYPNNYSFLVEVVDNDNFIFRSYSYGEEALESGFYRVNFANDVINSFERVYPRYLTESELNSMDGSTATFTEGESEEEATQTEESFEESTETVEDVVEEAPVVEDHTEETTENVEDTVEEETKPEEVVGHTDATEGMEENDNSNESEEKEKGEESSYTAALNDAERQELNEYRKKAKLELIESFADLSEETKEEFRTKIDEFTFNEIEDKLHIAFSKEMRKAAAPRRQVSVFNINSGNIGEDSPSDDSIEALIRKYK